jgi:hypothetical protein
MVIMISATILPHFSPFFEAQNGRVRKTRSKQTFMISALHSPWRRARCRMPLERTFRDFLGNPSGRLQCPQRGECPLFESLKAVSLDILTQAVTPAA